MNDQMLNVKFYNDRYRRFKCNLKDFIIDKRRSNHPIKKEDINLSVPKEYSFLYNY